MKSTIKLKIYIDDEYVNEIEDESFIVCGEKTLSFMINKVNIEDMVFLGVKLKKTLDEFTKRLEEITGVDELTLSELINEVYRILGLDAKSDAALNAKIREQLKKNGI